jgi:hypothetical protein
VNLDLCVGCQRPVMALRGQYTMLSPLSREIPGGTPAAEIAGLWHASCLSRAPLRGVWKQALLANYTEMRGYEVEVEIHGFAVLRDPRRGVVIALSADGGQLELTFCRGLLRRVPGGAIYGEHRRECNLQLDDEAVVAKMQQQLRAEKKVPMLEVFEHLGISDCVVHPEALEDSYLGFSKSLVQHWDKLWVTATCEYGVFVPEELMPYVVR